MSFSLESYLDELRPLVDIDCGSLTKPGIEEVATLFTEKYQQLGWHIKRIDLGDAGCGLEVRNKPEAEHIDVLMIGHMDTVFPVGTVAERPMHVEGDRAYGPGVADMKAGLLNIVYALRELGSEVLDKLSLCVCMNPDEEIGSPYSKPWLISIAKQSTNVLVAEAARADGSLVKARKGMSRYELNFAGKAAHSGNEPENGRSAISEMANWIVAIDKMTNFESGTTFNVGVVSGGDGANIVADHAKAIVDVRYWDNDEYIDAHEKLLSQAELPFIDGVTITIERVAHMPAMVPTSDTESLMKLVEQAGDETGVNIRWKAVGGGSDANNTASQGIPSLDGFGPIGGAFHSADEYLELNSIEPRIRLLKQVLTKLAG